MPVNDGAASVARLLVAMVLTLYIHLLPTHLNHSVWNVTNLPNIVFQLDSARIAASRTSPMMEAINLVSLTASCTHDFKKKNLLLPSFICLNEKDISWQHRMCWHAEWAVLPWWTLLGLQGPTLLIKSLPLIWRPGTSRWNLLVPDLQMNGSDLTSRWGTRIVVPPATARATCLITLWPQVRIKWSCMRFVYWVLYKFIKSYPYARCDMAFIEPMHRKNPKLLTYLSLCSDSFVILIQMCLG